jgi:hypothetical protein
MRPRQARLRPEYDEWYPEITAGVWLNAVWVTEKALEQQRGGSPSWAPGNRALSDAHFEFQGSANQARSRNGLQTRRTDRGTSARGE